jgi:hypothetical protein
VVEEDGEEGDQRGEEVDNEEGRDQETNFLNLTEMNVRPCAMNDVNISMFLRIFNLCTCFCICQFHHHFISIKAIGTALLFLKCTFALFGKKKLLKKCWRN